MMAEDMLPKPSVGRIVHYNHGGECVAAIVTNVWSRIPAGVRNPVDLTLFFASCTPEMKDEIIQGSTSGTWHWPERV